MRYYIVALVLFGLKVKAQENYSISTRQALETMWKSKDETGYKRALDMYENAFEIYPDSIDAGGLYKAAVLAGQLKELDKAFQFLTNLVEIDTDLNTGLSGWSSITGKYAESEYKNLINDPRWKLIKEKAVFKRNLFFKELKASENEFFNVQKNNFGNTKNPKHLYSEIKNHQPYLPKQQQNYSIAFKINDSTQTALLVHLPKNYHPEKKYPLLFFLHGAVRHNGLSDFQPIELNLGGWNRYYTKYAEQNEVILVFPKGSSQYNWMTPDDGFFMIPEMLKLIKKGINVDDNKVFISGHSNGATGSFSYWMKQPTQFAGFYGFNTYPMIFTGGTFVENSKNRSFINFSTDEDYYYPPNANDDFTKLMNGNNADYKEYRYNGFPHWFPEFDESEPAFKILFEDLIQRERNPFPKEISWEFDNENYGNIDWISDIKLDTLNSKTTWHKELNFKIDKWLEFEDQEDEDEDNDNLIVKEVDVNAFKFPRKSGKIKAEYGNNVFRIETSNIASFSILISPEMVHLKKKVKIYINGKLHFNEKIKYNQEFMLQNFEDKKDREQIWINYIKLKLKNNF